MRVVHYVNQFQAGLGGEDAAEAAPQPHDGPVGAGRLLNRLLGDDHEVVGSVSCGDDHAASEAGAVEAILALVDGFAPDLLVAGPAFSSGRYGLVTGRLLAAADARGLAAIGAMHPDSPGVDEAGAATLVASGAAASDMRASMQRLAAAAVKVLDGHPVTPDDGRIGRMPRRNTTADRRSATRAVDLALARLGGDREATEIPAGRFEVIRPAGPLADVAAATVALATEGGLVPAGNPDRLEAARATRWLAYPLDGHDTLAPGDWMSVDGGISTVMADADPHRLVPLDEMRELQSDGRLGGVHDHYLVTTGNGAAVATAQRFGVEWAADLHQARVQAVVLTAT